jgi:WD40 repeat protein
MFPRTMKTTSVLLLLLALGMGIGTPGHPVRAQRQPATDSAAPNAEPPKQPRLDLYSDPLPEGALVRLGTVRMRHGYIISGAVFSHDGKSIFASDYDSGVHVWDVAEGKEVRRFYKDDYHCHRLALSPDGRTLAVAVGNLTVRLCDPDSGREFGFLPSQEDRLDALVFSHDSSLLAIAIGRKSVQIWDVATRRLIRKVAFSEAASDVAFSADDKRIVCRVEDGSCRLWDFAQGKEIHQFKDESKGEPSLRAVFSGRGDLLAVSGYKDGSTRLFSADGTREVRRFQDEEKVGSKNARDRYERTTPCFSPDGRILATCSQTYRIDLWEVDSGRRLHTLAGTGFRGPSFLSFSPDGSRLLSTFGNLWGYDNIVRLWDVARGKEIRPLIGHGASLCSVALSPDGSTVATADPTGVIQLWERSSGKQLLRLEGYRGRRPEVAFSSDGQRLISWETDDGILRIWNARTGQVVNRLERDGPKADWMAVSDNGNLAVSVEQGRSVRFYDLTTGQVVRKFENDPHMWLAVLSPAGDRLAYMDGANVQVMNAVDGRNLMTMLIEHVAGGGCSSAMDHPWIAFSADGRRLATAVTSNALVGTPYEIAIGDAFEGREVRRFGKVTDDPLGIDAAALSRDGRTVITVGHGSRSDEQIITLWDAETGRERGGFLGHHGRTNGVAISADGRYFVTGANDTSALIWDATRPQTQKPVNRGVATAAEIAARYHDLAGEDAEQAYASIWALVNAPQQTVSFLADQSSLFVATDVRRIQGWIKDLDSDEFADRERGSRELLLVLDEAEGHLKKALQDKPSAELRLRLERLLDERRRGFTPKELQKYRVIEVLEHLAMSSADAPLASARGLLVKMAAGAPEARLTQEAKASLERLAGRGGRKP